MITDEEYDELMKLFFSPDNTPKEQPKKNEEYKKIGRASCRERV